MRSMYDQGTERERPMRGSRQIVEEAIDAAKSSNQTWEQIAEQYQQAGAEKWPEPIDADEI